MALSSVPLARARVGASLLPATDKGISDTYYGVVYDETGDQVAYIKDIPRIELANELLAATLAKGLNLPIVEPYLITVRTPQLNFTKGPQMPNPQMRLAFASADGSIKKIRVRINSGGLPVTEIRGWPHFPMAVCFDEWIANSDRNDGNLLFGNPDRFLLVDYGHAFTGPEWNVASLQPNNDYYNQLLQGWAKCALDKTVKERILNELGSIFTQIDQMDLSTAIGCSRVDTFLDALGA
jgi:hypothetical protein